MLCVDANRSALGHKREASARKSSLSHAMNALTRCFKLQVELKLALLKSCGECRSRGGQDEINILQLPCLARGLSDGGLSLPWACGRGIHRKPVPLGRAGRNAGAQLPDARAQIQILPARRPLLHPRRHQARALHRQSHRVHRAWRPWETMIPHQHEMDRPIEVVVLELEGDRDESAVILRRGPGCHDPVNCTSERRRQMFQHDLARDVAMHDQTHGLQGTQLPPTSNARRRSLKPVGTPPPPAGIVPVRSSRNEVTGRERDGIWLNHHRALGF
jgi:hypothetical protein